MGYQFPNAFPHYAKHTNTFPDALPGPKDTFSRESLISNACTFTSNMYT
mgnify:CR=1